MQSLSQHARLEKLSLELVISLSCPPSNPFFAQFDSVWESICRDIVESMGHLAGLKDFFVFLGWSRFEQEAALEKLIMGNDYDSASRGKFRYPVQWIGLQHLALMRHRSKVS